MSETRNEIGTGKDENAAGTETKNETVILILGGDLRQRALARFMSAKGYRVFTFGIWGKEGECEYDDQRISDFVSAEDALEASGKYRKRNIILPLPVSVDGKLLSCPLDKSAEIMLESLFEMIIRTKKTGNGTAVYGGRLSPKLKELAEKHGMYLLDYSESEEFQIRNALPSAEGAISLAMSELAVTLSGSHSAVIGYGRIGKVLSHLLSSLGSDVTVAARKDRDVAMSSGFGHKGLKISYGNDFESGRRESTLISLCTGYDVIFNTVPYWLIDRALLERMDKRTLIIDLASSPGGVDVIAARDNNIKSIWALSLPGKYAPVSAGEIIGECLIRQFTTDSNTE